MNHTIKDKISHAFTVDIAEAMEEEVKAEAAEVDHTSPPIEVVAAIKKVAEAIELK